MQDVKGVRSHVPPFPLFWRFPVPVVVECVWGGAGVLFFVCADPFSSPIPLPLSCLGGGVCASIQVGQYNAVAYFVDP